MKRIVCVIAIFITALSVLPTCVRAHCPQPEIRASGEYYQSDVVFTGTVIQGSYSAAAGGGYRLRVSRIFKGPVQKEFNVSTDSDNSRFPLDKGRTYLLFAYKGARGLEINSCGNSDLLSKAAKSVRTIENLPHAPPFGVIEGWVLREIEGWVGPADHTDFSGIRVTVTGQSRNYAAVTDKNGRFHFRAPVGRYEVDFSLGEYYPDDDSLWYDPHGFDLHAGETASLLVVSTRHLAK
jgi:hypothetical protein